MLLPIQSAFTKSTGGGEIYSRLDTPRDHGMFVVMIVVKSETNNMFFSLLEPGSKYL